MTGRNAVNTDGRMRVGNGTVDTGNNFAHRHSRDGGADITGVSNNVMGDIQGQGTTPYFGVNYYSNLANKEKLMISHLVHQAAAGAGGAPARNENVGKWSNTTSIMDVVNIYTGGSDTWNANSEVVVLGWDPNDTHTTNFWQELASTEQVTAGSTISATFTPKKYLWIQAWINGGGDGNNTWLEFNDDNTASYASRNSSNGASDITLINRTDGLFMAHLQATQGAGQRFFNAFILNRSANEKLCIHHGVARRPTGAGNAPDRMEGVGKWANTTSQINKIELNMGGTGNVGAGSILKVWGAD